MPATDRAIEGSSIGHPRQAVEAAFSLDLLELLREVGHLRAKLLKLSLKTLFALLDRLGQHRGNPVDLVLHPAQRAGRERRAKPLKLRQDLPIALTRPEHRLREPIGDVPDQLARARGRPGNLL